MTVLDIDPFSETFLADPYPEHETMREAAAVVRLSRYGIWAMARHQEVQTGLSDWETYCSSAGVGLSDFRKEKPWRDPSLLLEVDPPLHTRTRAVLTRIMSPAALRGLRATFEAAAETLVERLIGQGEIDAIKDLAEIYPLRVFPDAVGLPLEGRENLLPYGSMAFNAFGPRNRLFEEAMASAAPIAAWIGASCQRDKLKPGGFGARIHEAVDRGELTAEEAPLIVRSLLTAGVDTTVNGLGNALFAFAGNPDQWQVLRDNPTLARQAFDEALRYESPVQTFFRTTTRDVEVAGTAIPAGEKVLLLLGAANRDHRRWPDPHRFDIQRRAAGHVGFGTGIHGCVGQAVARMEAEAVFGALVKRVAAIEPLGPAQRRLNNTLRGLTSLPVRLKAA